MKPSTFVPIKNNEGFYQSREYFDSIREALDFMNLYMSNYPPQGYGTKLTLTYASAPERWEVEIKRYENCD